ncbi:MAG: TIGR03905 family TSCPD domain-containing protein [Clostridia bacterium]|nr:TIGR03905 family TSCPD domain-containing protein [Clostridia bacterium]
MTYQYTPKGVCSRLIEFSVEDGIIKDVRFSGGCNGNLKGISALVSGMEVDEVINRLQSIRCGFKDTSCPAQLAKALIEFKKKNEE